MAQIPGLQLPTTEIWNAAEIEQAKIENAGLKRLLVEMYAKLNRMALSIGDRESGMYPLVESLNGQKWFPNPSLNSTTQTNPAQRQDYRKVFNLGAWPAPVAPATFSLIEQAHGIEMTANTMITRLWAIAKDPTSAPNPPRFIPIPFVNAASFVGEAYIDADAKNIYIKGEGDFSKYKEVIAVIEYLQN